MMLEICCGRSTGDFTNFLCHRQSHSCQYHNHSQDVCALLLPWILPLLWGYDIYYLEDSELNHKLIVRAVESMHAIYQRSFEEDCKLKSLSIDIQHLCNYPLLSCLKYYGVKIATHHIPNRTWAIRPVKVFIIPMNKSLLLMHAA